MGEAKRKQEADRDILERQPFCCFCGDLADEIDHVPPRCFFIKNEAPRGFVFPSCKSCNRLTRQDDQTLGVIMPMSLDDGEHSSEDRRRELRLIRGLKNNNWPVISEWRHGIGGAAQKRMFRERFGADGDLMRHQGFGLVTLGEETKEIYDRFALKLGHALFFKHIGRRLTGKVIFSIINFVESNKGVIEKLLSAAPSLSHAFRNGRDLSNRFSYRFNSSIDVGCLWLVVYFGGQQVIALLAAEETFCEGLTEQVPEGFAPPNWTWLSSSFFRENRVAG